MEQQSTTHTKWKLPSKHSPLCISAKRVYFWSQTNPWAPIEIQVNCRRLVAINDHCLQDPISDDHLLRPYPFRDPYQPFPLPDHRNCRNRHRVPPLREISYSDCKDRMLRIDWDSIDNDPCQFRERSRSKVRAPLFRLVCLLWEGHLRKFCIYFNHVFLSWMT